MQFSELTVSGGDLIVPFTPQQLPIYFRENKEKITVVVKGRRVGITGSAASYTPHCLIAKKSILWVDTVQANIIRYFNKFFFPIYRQIKPEYWKFQTQRHELTLIDTKMDFRSSEKPDNIEGFGYHVIVLNEAGLILKGDKGRKLWFETILPMTIDYDAEIYLIGTSKGKKAKKDEDSPKKTSLYYELACKGGYDDHERSPRYRTIVLSSYDNPMNTKAVIQEIEEEVPLLVRQQEITGKFIDTSDEKVFKKEWFPVVYELPTKHLWLRKIISLDTAFKKGAENDDSAGVCILETKVGYFVVDCFAEKLEFPELCTKTEGFYTKNNADFGIVEDKASGTSLVQTYRRNLNFNLISILPEGDKFSRANAATYPCEAGKVFLLAGPWNMMFIEQLCAFNEQMDTPDDIVDAFSQIINYFKISKRQIPKSQSRNVTLKSNILQGY
jgi:predicted phage terminase large subunit-like protein